VLIAALPTAVGIGIDMFLSSKPGMLFTALYVVGCVLAVTLVRRSSVFGAMVQPPLVLAVTMPVIVLITGSGNSTGGGTSSKVLSIASPLINGFPVMACTTALVLGIGLVRMFGTQRAPRADDDLDGPTRSTKKRAKQADPRREKAEPRKKKRADGAPAGEKGARPDAARRGDPRRREPRRDDPRRGEPGRGRPSGEREPGRNPRGAAPGRSRGGDKPDPRSSPPPGRGTGPRQQNPGRSGGEPPRRPRRPRRDEGF
jgi:hypothetical protein